MKTLIVLFFSLFSIPVMVNAQNAVPAAMGIYIDLGKDIPKQLSYLISRREARSTDWKELSTLRFQQDSASFYADLTKASEHYEIFTLPENRLRSNIWKMISKAATTDSVLYYGYTPAYREALHTAYYDETAMPNVDYEYKVTTVLSSNQRVIKESVIKGRFPAAVKKDFQVMTLTIKPFNGNMVLKYISNGIQKPAGVRVLRRTYMQTEFTAVNGQSGAVNQADTVFYMATDSLLEKEKVYEYVAIPFDELGSEGMPSDTVRIANVLFNNSGSVRSFTTKSLEKENAIKLSWKLNKTANLQGVNIYRSEVYDSKSYKLIARASAIDSVYLDTKVHPVKNYFYSLIPVNQYGNGYPSARVAGMLKANKKAMAPQGLLAEATDNKIRLSWRKPEYYTRGYYVYRSRGGTDTLKQVTDLIITDSLNVVYNDIPPASENGMVYTYAIRAVNTSYDISPLSDRVNIITPLKVKLTTPLNISVRLMGNMVMVFWNNKSDQNYLSFNVYRRAKTVAGNDKFDKINTSAITALSNYFEDKTAIADQAYEYSVQAVSINGQLSEMSVPVVLNVAYKQLLPAYNLSVYADSGSVLINWDQTEQQDAVEYKVYRLKGDQKELLGTVNKLVTIFEDKKANAKELNTYAVTCSSKTTESKLSDPVSIRLE